MSICCAPAAGHQVQAVRQDVPVAAQPELARAHPLRGTQVSMPGVRQELRLPQRAQEPRAHTRRR